MRMQSISISFPIFQMALRYTRVKITNSKEVPSNHAEHTSKELMRMLSIRISSLWYAQHARQKLNAA
jgi:hypothetical protein